MLPLRVSRYQVMLWDRMHFFLITVVTKLLSLDVDKLVEDLLQPNQTLDFICAFIHRKTALATLLLIHVCLRYRYNHLDYRLAFIQSTVQLLEVFKRSHFLTVRIEFNSILYFCVTFQCDLSNHRTLRR